MTVGRRIVSIIGRLLAPPETLAPGTAHGHDRVQKRGVDFFALLAPVGDFIAFLTAVWLETSPYRAQMIGFGVGAAVCLGSLVRTRLRGALEWTFGRYAVALAIFGLVLSLRDGTFALLTDTFGLPAWATTGVLVIATAVLLRTGLAYLAEGSSLQLGDGKHWRSGVIALALLAYALRFIYCGQIDLLPTEAYYWNYSRHLDIGYLDHPPMVALLIRAGTAVFGNSEFGVRTGALFCNLIGTLFMFRLARNLFGEASAFLAVLLLQTLPFFFLSGMVMNPDAPLTAAWIASLYYLERALIARRARAWWGVGICLGLGLFSKYTIALLAISVAIFMIVDAPSRAWWRRPEPYGAAALAGAIFVPVILWNAEHEWASFAFQSSRRLAEEYVFGLPRFLTSAFLLLSPTGAIAAGLLLRRRAPLYAPANSKNQPSAWLLLQVTLGVPLLVFAIFSLSHEIVADWLGPPFSVAIPCLAFSIAHAREVWTRGPLTRLKAIWMPTLFALLLLDGVRFQYFTLGISGLGYGDHPERVPVGWRELGRQVHGLAQQSSRSPLIVGMDRYFLASELSFYATNPDVAGQNVTSAQLFGHPGLMYERWASPTDERGRTLLLVAWDAEALDSPEVQAGAQELGPLREGELRRNGQFVRRYYYRFAFDYLGRSAEPAEFPRAP